MVDQAVYVKAIEDRAVMEELLYDLLPENKDKNRRYASFLTLQQVSESHPELLYEKWDFLEKLLRSNNTNSKYNALHLIANLACVDREDKFEGVFDAFFGMINDEKTSVAAHIAGCSGRIARAKPGLQSRITARLLELGGEDNDHKRRDLIAGYAIESFGEYFDASEDKDLITRFVRTMLACDSPKTQKLAKKFLEDRGL